MVTITEDDCEAGVCTVEADVKGSENTESVGSDVELGTVNMIVEVVESDKQSQIVVMENVEALSVEDDEPLEAEATDDVPNINAEETTENTESVESEHQNIEIFIQKDACADIEQTQIEVKETLVIDQLPLRFPATFVSRDLNIQFGSFGDTNRVQKDSNLETELECYTTINKPEPDLIGLQESDKNVTCEDVDDIDDGQGDGQRVAFSPYCFLVQVLKVEDEKLNERIKNAEMQLDEKRRCKDAISDELHIKWESILGYNEALHAKNMELRAAKKLVKSKRLQIDHVQRVINKVKNAAAVEDIDSRISKAEHVMEHETLCLEDERQFIREIKQLKSMRVQLASNMGSPDEIKHMLDQNDQIEELLKNLNMELKTLKDKVSKTQVASSIIRKKYLQDLGMERELRDQFIASEESYKEAYAHLHSLKIQLNDKVERFMDKWNRNEEFTIDYIIRCNMHATQNTQDEPSRVVPNDTNQKVGSDLGPTHGKVEPLLAITDLETQELVKSVEEQHSKENVLEEVDQKMVGNSGSTVDEGETISAVSNLEATETVKSVEEQRLDCHIKDNVLEEVEQMVKHKECIKPTEIIEIKENEEPNGLIKEEIELTEKVRLEENMKANEAHERKKQNVKKAQTRAELKAQQEAQHQEKRRLKRLKKKDKKRAAQEKKRAARDTASSSIADEIVAELNKSKNVENTTRTPVDVAIRNKISSPHWGNMIITVVVLILSMFSLFH